ncbi:MAG TPA: hypothetical protein VHX68_10670, partial [Planctomycetaceae bacterium]|nr:hypothetical protein [Planctomycetaceae bacterium]
GPGQLQQGWKQHDDDNDGLWTSLYVAAESFRFASTGDEKARQQASRSLKALMFLESVTGTPGYVARSVVPAGTRSVRDPERWRPARDPAWRWKSDTSSDELCGHFFAYPVYYDLAATVAEKEEIRKVVARITDRILDHDFYYVDPDGHRTTWGIWNPKEINGDPKWVEEHGLNSLEILSFLKVAAHIVGKPRYEQVARELIEKHGYARNTVKQKIKEAANHSDDELAFLAYYPLLKYERDPKLRELYLASIRRSWEIARPEQSPLFNYIYAAALQADHWTNATARPPIAEVPPTDYDADACVEWFREVPTDLVDWMVDNSGRNDASAKPFSVFERGILKWNGNPYELKRGGAGRSCDDGTFILLPYWMGVYHRFVD